MRVVFDFFDLNPNYIKNFFITPILSIWAQEYLSEKHGRTLSLIFIWLESLMRPCPRVYFLEISSDLTGALEWETILIW